jgi:hypothetical protein
MDSIPNEFLTIINRLTKLLTFKLIPINENEFDYEDAVWRFKVLAASPTWKSPSEIVIVKIKELVGQLFENNYLMYSQITSHYEKHPSNEIIAKFKTIDGGIAIVTPKEMVKVKFETNDEHRKSWFNNIVPELRAYEALSKDGLGIRNYITKEKAIEISLINVKGVGDLISTVGDSRMNFVRLLSDPCLLDYEISRMKIFIGVPVKTFSIEINKLFKLKALPFINTQKLIGNNCFFHTNKGKDIQITKANFSSSSSKSIPRNSRYSK